MGSVGYWVNLGMERQNKKKSSSFSSPIKKTQQNEIGNSKTILATIDSTPIYRRFTPNLPADISLRSRARGLRKRANLPEVVFWQQVHKKKFFQIDFDRQRIIGRYIVDFYIKGLSLIIEIDGSSHDNKENYDQKRENYFKALGLRIYRINARDVTNDVDQVIINLKNYILNNYTNS